MSSPFYTLLYRLRLTPRWNGTFTVHPEDVAQHSHSVALIAHALCMIKQNIFGETVDVGKVVTYAIYHDSADAVLTHVISPVKSHEYVKKHFSIMKKAVDSKLVGMLPKEFHPAYRDIFFQEKDSECVQIVNIADQLDALCKAKTEVNRGNFEFQVIHDQLEEKVNDLAVECPYVRYFLDEFLPFFTEKRINFRYL